MKVAVSISEPVITSPVSEIFGRSEYFLIYNDANEAETILHNPFEKTFGGAGIQTAQFLIENDVKYVVVKKIGTNAYRVFESAEIIVFHSEFEPAINEAKKAALGYLKPVLVDTNNQGKSHKRKHRHKKRNNKN